MDARRWLIVGCLSVCVRLLSGCGPGDLPAFANPPPYDAGARTDAGHSDSGDTDEDAGSTDGGTR